MAELSIDTDFVLIRSKIGSGIYISLFVFNESFVVKLLVIFIVS